MSRNAMAGEIARLILQIQQAAEQGERLALSSGGMVSPTHFRAAQLAARQAAGDLDSKGLLAPQPAEEKAPA